MPQQHPNQDALEQALGRLYQAQPSPRFEEGWRAAVRLPKKELSPCVMKM